MRAYSYERISRDDDGTAPSPENQLEINRRAIDAAGDRCVGHETDRNLSGIDERPGLARLLEKARGDGIGRIYISDWLRWGRGKVAAHYAHLAEMEGIELVSSTEGADGDLVREIKWAAGGELCRTTSRRVKAEFKVRRSRAAYIGGRNLLGYRWEGLGTARAKALGTAPIPFRRVIVPEEIGIPRAICERYDPGGEAATQTVLAQEYGLTRKHVQRILAHPAYAGGYIVQRSERITPRGALRIFPWENWEIIWEAHEPAIPRELWERNRARLLSVKAGRGEQPGRATHALTGLVRCPECRQPLRLEYSRRRDGRSRYVCPDAECPGRSWTTTGWVGSILPWVVTQLATKEFAQRIHKGYLAAYAQGRQDQRGEAEIASLRARCRRLEDAIGRGLILDTTNLELDLGRTQKALRIAQEAQDRRSRVSTTIPSQIEIETALASCVARAEALAASPEIDFEARAFLHRLLDQIIVIDRSSAEISFRLDLTSHASHPWGRCPSLVGPTLRWKIAG